MGRLRGDQHDATAFAHRRHQLLHQKVGRARVQREQFVEIGDGGVFNACVLRHTRAAHQYIQTSADHDARSICQPVWPIRRAQVRRNFLGVATGCANLRNHFVCRRVFTAIVNQNLGACFREGQRASAARAARGARNERGFSAKRVHDQIQGASVPRRYSWQVWSASAGPHCQSGCNCAPSDV